MKSKVKKELHTKTIQELKQLLKETRDGLFKLKLEHARKKLKNTSLISEKRKEIAKIMTIIREGELKNEDIWRSCYFG